MPWRSNMLRLAYADSGSACKLAQDMVPTAHTQIEVRAQPLESSLGRVPQAADGTCKKIRKPDRVGRRGLSEPREDFSRLPTYAWTQKWFVQIMAAD